MTTSGAIDPARLRRIRWRCRRGMLENDLVLARFLDASGATLTEDDVAKLDALLHMSDNALWDLIAGRTEAADPGLAAFVARLRAVNPVGAGSAA
jgi:antitoxin CptB